MPSVTSNSRPAFIGRARTAACVVAFGLSLSLSAVPTAAAAPSDPLPVSSSALPRGSVVNVIDLEITTVQQLLESGSVTSEGLVVKYLARIAAYDAPFGDEPGINAIIALTESALADARALDAERAAGVVRVPLHGVPVVVKDNYDLAGMPTTNGSMALKDFRPADDSTQVARLREAGAVIIAKTNLHEFAAGITTISSLGGQTRNPYDQSRNPGGSSGGTGASVAAGFATAGLGTDTCRSIRIPSSHNSLVGLRPSLGLSSRDGIAPLSLTQDVGGPIVHSVADAAIILDATVGFDPKDPVTALGTSSIPRSYTESLSDTALDGATIGLITNPEYLGVTDAEVPTSELVRAAVADFEQQGAIVKEVSIPQDVLDDLQGDLIPIYEAKRDLNAYLAQDGAEYPAEIAALSGPTDALTLSDLLATGEVNPNVAAIMGFTEPMVNPGPEYDRLLATASSLKTALAAVFAAQGLDALAYPSIRQPAAVVDDTADQPGKEACEFSAEAGFPAITVPAGYTDEGLPVGVEMLGLPFTETTLLGLAYDYEQATRHRVAPGSVPPLAGDTITVASSDSDPSLTASTNPVVVVAIAVGALVTFGLIGWAAVALRRIRRQP